MAGGWICLLLKRPTACGMACILPCVILITGVTGVTRYYYAAARIIETVVGLLIALGVNAALPDLRPEPKKEAPHMQVEVKNSTKKLCVIGEPVLHSKSPLIQNTMLAALGLEGPAIGAAQRRLAAHILSHPEDNTPARLLALARAELSGP